MITSKENEKLKLIRRLAERKHRDREGLFMAEGEDLVDAAAAAGAPAEFVLRAGEDVEPELLGDVSTLGSGTRVIGVYRQVPARAVENVGLSNGIDHSSSGSGGGAGLAVYLHGVGDPGNVGAIVRCVDALVSAAVVLGPKCADPYSPKAVRASMGSIFSVPVGAGGPGGGDAPMVGLVAHGGEAPDDQPVGCLCLGGEREGLPAELVRECDRLWTIPLREGGAESLNVAAAAAIALGRISSAALEGKTG